MSTPVLQINKGINRPIEFKGIKGQYILYMGIGLVALLLLFAILYVIGINIYACLIIILPAGGTLVIIIQRMSKKYGEFGLSKMSEQRKLPAFVSSSSRKIFIDLKAKTK